MMIVYDYHCFFLKWQLC